MSWVAMALRLPSDVDSALILEIRTLGWRRSKARMIRSATTAPRRDGISETHQVSRAGFFGTVAACATRSSTSLPPHPDASPAATALPTPHEHGSAVQGHGMLLPFHAAE